jgi:hypothetical protein
MTKWLVQAMFVNGTHADTMPMGDLEHTERIHRLLRAAVAILLAANALAVPLVLRDAEPRATAAGPAAERHGGATVAMVTTPGGDVYLADPATPAGRRAIDAARRRGGSVTPITLPPTSEPRESTAGGPKTGRRPDLATIVQQLGGASSAPPSVPGAPTAGGSGGGDSGGGGGGGEDPGLVPISPDDLVKLVGPTVTTVSTVVGGVVTTVPSIVEGTTKTTVTTPTGGATATTAPSLVGGVVTTVSSVVQGATTVPSVPSVPTTAPTTTVPSPPTSICQLTVVCS